MSDLRDRVTEAFPWVPIPDIGEDGYATANSDELFFRGTPEQFLSASRRLVASEALGEEEAAKAWIDWMGTTDASTYCEAHSNAIGFFLHMQRRLLGTGQPTEGEG